MSWILIGIYNFLYFVILVLYLPYLFFVRRRDWAYVFERLRFPGNCSLKRKKRVWIHAVSVGETNVALTLAKSLRKNYDVEVFISSSTPTGIENLTKKAKDIFVFYAPWDILPVVSIFAKKLLPDFMLIVETELWPSLIFYLSKICPVFLVNARISDRAFDRYKLVRVLLNVLIFKSLKAVLCQDVLAKNRFVALGLEDEKVMVVGNMKFDVEIEPKRIEVLERIRETSRFTFVFGSTHEGEEKTLMESLKHKWQKGWFVVIVPRHVSRVVDISRMLEKLGLSWAFYSKFQVKETEGIDVLIVDVIGILPYIYRYADVVFIGGSLVDKGGQNPLEALYWAKPVFFGPYMENFYEICQCLLNNRAAMRVSSALEFVEWAVDDKLLSDLSRNAALVMEENRGSIFKTCKIIFGEQ